MSLLLIRHGQASYGKANYDELSATGHHQSKKLGQWLVSHQHVFQQVRIGTMQRHLQTFALIAEAYREHGLALPEPVQDASLNEFDHDAVFSSYSRLNADDPVVKAAASRDQRAVGAMVHAALLAWTENSLGDLPESWDVFGQRAKEAAKNLPQTGDTLAISSGGLISRIAQQAMEIPDHRAIDLNIALRNSAISEFHPRHSHWRLGMWNALPHLHDMRDMWTYF
jgi:broad specificity phosphatase PhoE